MARGSHVVAETEGMQLGWVIYLMIVQRGVACNFSLWRRCTSTFVLRALQSARARVARGSPLIQGPERARAMYYDDGAIGIDRGERSNTSRPGEIRFAAVANHAAGWLAGQVRSGHREMLSEILFLFWCSRGLMADDRWDVICPR
ncbi:hypothetical protein BRADI_3g37227v3 [Brachypodium distachyon]|uniref:Uncharacterized protein n=1 Tax=Brachypodium distachyon TaxID=15368 RepID=A0A2K2D1P3_BRADI|nr:hypothetical protein BRADI_3g37227v3 [Brachypodium distachyon]